MKPVPFVYNLRSLRQRWRPALLAVVGIALTVAVLVTLSALADGFRLALRASGSPQNAIAFQRGSNSELTSWISIEHARRLAADVRIARDRDGHPMASCETVVVTALPRSQDAGLANVTMRGATPFTVAMHEGFRLEEGREFRRGVNEAIVGRKVRERVRGLDVGQTVRFQKREFRIVGVFSAGGSAFESEIWSDGDALRSALARQGGCNTLVVRYVDGAAVASLAKDVERSPDMQLELKPERKYYEDQASPLAEPMSVLLTFVSVVMGIGATFAGMNTMYALVASRTREIGTLRVLGFSRRSILISFSIESLLLALAGGTLGCLAALPADALTATSGATAAFADLTWALQVTPAALVRGMLFAAAIGLAGGMLPAIRAARLKVTRALNEC